MRRIIYILLILASFNINVHAKGKSGNIPSRMTFGLEWGYVATFQAGYFHYFFAPEGYRVEDRGNGFGLISNADMYAHMGYNLNEKWNLSLYIGYEGIADIHKAVPVSLRMTRYFGSDAAKDRWFAFLDLGSGICLKKEPQDILTGKIGGGYRLVLSRFTSLDFIVSARSVHTHTQIVYDKVNIPLNRTNSNIAYANAISIGMALTF